MFDSGPYQDRGEAIALFQRFLSDQFATKKTTTLLLERPFFREGAKGADFVYGLIWAAHATAWLYGVNRREMTANDVRKWLIGRTRKNTDAGETKSQFQKVIRAAVEARGYFVESVHAVDAAALLIACEKIPAREAA